jgi:superfamily II DNA or RNA helicase
MEFEVIHQKDGPYLRITKAEPKEIKQITSWLARYKEDWMFDPAVKMGLWDGKNRYMRDAKCRLGLWGQVKEACDKYGYEFKVINKDKLPLLKGVDENKFREWVKVFFSNRKIKDKDIAFYPYEYQIKAAWKMIKYGHTMTEIATGGGKTLITSMVVMYLLSNIDSKAKCLVIAPSILLVKQFYNDLMDYNFGYNKENPNPIDIRIEEIMSDKPRSSESPNVVIATYQSLGDLDAQYFKQFTDIIVDEAHGAGSKTMKKILRRCINARIKAGVSGTFPPKDSMEVLEIEQFLGPKVTVIPASMLIKSGTISNLTIKALILNHNRPDFYRHCRMVSSSGGGTEALLLERKFIHESEARMNMILDRMIGKAKKNTLCLFYTIEFGTSLYEEAKKRFTDRDIYYIDGEQSGTNRSQIIKDMEISDPNRPKILIASYGTLSTGVSIKAIFNIIFADSYKSYKIVRQSIGRGLRLHSEKEKLNVFDIVDIYQDPKKNKGGKGNIFWKHWNIRKKIYNEQSYAFTETWIDL